MTYTPITYDASKVISEAQYRLISTSNDIDISKYILKTKKYGSTADTAGLINTSGIDEGKFDYVPLAKRTVSDIATKENVIFLDNSGTLTFKSATGFFPISTAGRQLIPIVSSLPNSSTITAGFTELVEHENKLKWWSATDNAWKTLISS